MSVDITDRVNPVPVRDARRSRLQTGGSAGRGTCAIRDRVELINSSSAMGK